MGQHEQRGTATRASVLPAGAVVGLLVALVVLGFVTVAAREAGPLPVEKRTLPLSVPDITMPELPPRPPIEEEVPASTSLDTVGMWSMFVMLGLLGVVVILVVARLLRWRADRDVEPTTPPPPLDGGAATGPATDHLRYAARLAEDDLRTTSSGGEGVVAAWLRLEGAAADVGTPRSPAATPAEFTVDLLGRHQADRDALATLLGLYQRARFAHETLPPETTDDAIAAVRAIAASLGPLVPTR